MNKQKGSIIVIILLLLAGAGLVFVGYNYAFKPKPQKTIIPTHYPIEAKPTAGQVLDSDLVDWKTYRNTTRKAFITDGWTGYRPTETIIPFEIKYPSDWKEVNHNELGFGTFQIDPNNIFDFSPGVVLLESNQKCYYSYIPSTDKYTKLISRENIEIGNYQVVKLVKETMGYSHGWFVDEYCLQENNKAVVISFYSTNHDKSTDKTLQYQILSTFRFTKNSQSVTTPSSYEACMSAPGSKILETFPEQCVTADGERFPKP